ncbi:MAG: hypothetical protein RIQ53_2842 [Pseudomonadota bacterium]|jgi:hypothetical protein
MRYIINRMREPSTWAGVASLIGLGLQAWQTRDPAAIGAAVAGAVAIVVPERAP